MKIIITGDLYITDQFINKQIIDKSVKELFSQADYRIVNLEAPLTEDDAGDKIIKTGPHLRMSEEAALGVLKELNVDGVTMANNHILDYGSKGLLDTLDVLKRNNFAYVGAGRNLAEASQTLYLDTPAGKIAIVNFAENEWASATDDKAGANPMDIVDNARQIKVARQMADYVFVIVHGGHEYYNLPSLRMQKQYRFYAEQGADIIIGHHTHCIGGNEVHEGVPIYYSLGNFLFTLNSLQEDWYTGLILEVEITNESIECHVHPVRQQKENFHLTLLKNYEKDAVLNRIADFCRVIENKDRLQSNWEKYVERQSKLYLSFWSPLAHIKNRYIKAALSRLNINATNNKTLALFLNLMRCEAHSDMSREVIKKKINR